MPDVVGREEILRVHARKVPLAETWTCRIARGTAGFSGADLRTGQRGGAARRRRGTPSVGAREFEDARDRVTMGAERRSSC